MVKIDSHQHFWKYDPIQHAWISDDMKVIRQDFGPDNLAPLLKQHGIDGCVTVQVDQTEEETGILIAHAEERDFIAGVVGWIDLRASNLESRLEHFSEFRHLKGFRHIVQGEAPGFLGQRSFIDGVGKLHKFNYCYDLLIYHHQLAEALTFVDEVADTPIVIDHIAKPSIRTGDIATWRNQIRAIAKYPNVHCKVSGMVTEAKWPGWGYDDFVPYLDTVVEAFGADRLLYGSDWPVCLVAASYDQQFSIIQDYFKSFSQTEKENIFGGNAVRFYKL